MSAPQGAAGSASVMGNWNYFNYFTEIEEYFWKKRGAHLLVSPLDWAVMETWQKAGVPLDAVLKGIDRAFESYRRSRRGAGKPLKSLAYCTDAVLEAATEQQDAATGVPPRANHQADQPFSREALRRYFDRNISLLRAASEQLETTSPRLAETLLEYADSLVRLSDLLSSPALLDTEDLERRLTVLDEKLQAELTAEASEDLMLRLRREMDGQLALYRRKMKAEQLALIEKQYIQKRLLEEYGIPRLSLFYLQ